MAIFHRCSWDWSDLMENGSITADGFGSWTVRAASWSINSIPELPAIHRRSRPVVVLSEVAVLHTVGSRGGDVPSWPLGPAQCVQIDGHARRGHRVEGVPSARERSGDVVVPLSSSTVDRDPGEPGKGWSGCSRTRSCSPDHLRADAGVNRLHGVGVSEAPRRTLFHDYEVDRDGVVTR